MLRSRVAEKSLRFLLLKKIIKCRESGEGPRKEFEQQQNDTNSKTSNRKYYLPRLEMITQ